MLIRKIVAATLLALSISPLVLLAQTAPDPICAIPKTTYALGTRGENVTVIQQFLVDQGVLNAEPTGYFGVLTEAALTQFQLTSGIISNVSDGGIFGRRTWNYISAHYCTSQQQPPPQRTDITICPTPPSAYPPTNVSCDSKWQRIMTSEGCHVGWSCVTYITTSTTTSNKVVRNFAPTIYAIQGPLTVATGNSATWVIRASDQDNDKMGYSMIWGDEGVNLSQLMDLSGQGDNYLVSNSFTHKYSSPGVYTMIGYVKDEAGNTNKAVITITASNPPPPPPPPASTSTTPTTTPGIGSCTFNGITYASTTVIQNPICANITNCSASRYLKCVNGNWSPSDNSGTTNPPTGTCVMNGRSYNVGQMYGGDGTVYGDPSNGCTKQGTADKSCAPGGVVCGSSGWVGAPATGNVKYACMSANSIFVASGARAYGICYRSESNQCGDFGGGMPGSGYFACRNDGWWTADANGTPASQLSTLPTIVSTY